MAEKKKEKSDTVLDCPLGHAKSMKYVSRENRDIRSNVIRRMVRRNGPSIKIALCSKCGLILTFADIEKDSKIIEG